MAVLDAIPGLLINIVSRGRNLPEYPDEVEDAEEHGVSATKQTSTYVECATGEEFEIIFRITPEFEFHSESLTLWVAIDGISNDGIIFLPGETRTQTMHGRIVVSNSTERRIKAFRFSSITKVDDANLERINKDASLAKKLGRIIVKVHNTDSQLQAITARVAKSDSAISEVAEKALKGQAISHGVSYGEEKSYRVVAQEHVVSYPDGEHNPRGIFMFKYRSRAALQSELIIPRSPSPEYAASPEVERRRALEAELERIKSELKKESGAHKRDNDDDDEISHRDRPYKVSRKRSGKIIVDLTDDD